MAGLIAALFGGKTRPADPNPLPGIGGYQMPPGPAGETGFPGSTGQTRTFSGLNPRAVGAGVKADSDTGWDSGPGSQIVSRQASYRGDVPGGSIRNPRLTDSVDLPNGAMRQSMQQNDPSEFYGGPALKTRPGNRTAGGQPLTPNAQEGGHSGQETQTPWRAAQPDIGENTPGAQNVRNTISERWKNPAGQVHTYQSASRPDQAPLLKGGQATDGSVKPWEVSSPVSVPNRFVFDDGGNQTWAVLREMPYGGRGNGARGADLNGQRYYAEGQSDQFWNGGQGDYGIARQRGGRRPTASFQIPAPWTQNFYDTTDSIGTTDTPGTDGQYVNQIYVSPSTGRASDSTGRTG